MQTLIELYDERPLENVLGVEMFHPEKVLYLCPDQIASNHLIHENLRLYFKRRGLRSELVFLKANIYDTDALLALLQNTIARYPDCALDITGGTDAMLFAAGLLCAEVQIPVFTYSRKMNRFYNIKNAPFADKLPCDVSFTVEDCFMMAGGSMRAGRVDNDSLDSYLCDIDPFFSLYMRYRRQWVKAIGYIQRVSACDPDGNYSLEVLGKYSVKGERASIISAPENILLELEEIGFISSLRIVPDDSVQFRFRDGQIRAWLRDVGSVLELKVYKSCLDTKLFQDVRISAVVDWEGPEKVNSVSNELDVMCTKGVTPIFISCKTCDVRTEALNELAVLRDRFGGKIAKAAIVTAERGGAAMRNRAAELNISVIDLNDLTMNLLEKRIRNLVS